MQLSLLDRGGALDARAQGDEVSWARRCHVDLGEGAWLELVRGWALAHADWFSRLEESADWEHHERQMYERVVAVPRLVASCPGAEPARPWTGETAVRVLPHRASAESVRRSALGLGRLQGLLSRQYGRRLGSISLAYYRGGEDSVAFHGDRLGALRSDTVVAILSLGAARRFLLRRTPERSGRGGGALPHSLLAAGIGVVRSRAATGATFALSVGEGDLLVMGGTCQETWEHAVPKQAGAGPRIAVMFRERADEGEGALRNVRAPLDRDRVERGPALRARGGR